MKLFGKRIEPSCCYCKEGRKSQNGRMILCLKAGVVAPYYSCRKFQYDPLKRIPRRNQTLQKFDKEDFTL